MKEPKPVTQERLRTAPKPNSIGLYATMEPSRIFPSSVLQLTDGICIMRAVLSEVFLHWAHVRWRNVEASSKSGTACATFSAVIVLNIGGAYSVSRCWYAVPALEVGMNMCYIFR